MPDDIKEERRLTPKDWSTAGDYMAQEATSRENRRKDLVKQWDEVDRQLRMEPKIRVTPRGASEDYGKWMSNIELPLQAGALEVLTADARRLMFPDDREFFQVHANMEDDKIKAMEENNIVAGMSKENEALLESLPGPVQKVDQRDLDDTVHGVLTHFHSLYDLRLIWDALNAEALSKGTLCGRVRLVRDDKFSDDFRGRYRQTKLMPVLTPQPLRNTLLDDTYTASLHHGFVVSPNQIYKYWHNINDLKLAAQRGSKDPTAINGGWMPDRLKGLESTHRDKVSIEVLQYEGDLVVPRSRGESIFLPNVRISCALGSYKSKATATIFRYEQINYRSYIHHPYHIEDILSPYGTSPLMKGRPIQEAATEAFNCMMNAAKLSTEPPGFYSPNDHWLEEQGGPIYEPGAMNPALTRPEFFDVGSADSMMNVLVTLLMQYSDVTGISAPRLGAQTKSHQTAFAVDTELTRGVVRTVDYVRSLFTGPLRAFLSLEYEMIREILKAETVYVPKQHGWLKVDRSMLPEHVTFDVYGAGGPLEERQKRQEQAAALQQVMQIETMRRQLGERGMDFGKLQMEILGNAGYPIDRILDASSTGVPEGTAGGPPVPAADEGAQGPQADPLAALVAGV